MFGFVVFLLRLFNNASYWPRNSLDYPECKKLSTYSEKTIQRLLKLKENSFKPKYKKNIILNIS